MNIPKFRSEEVMYLAPTDARYTEYKEAIEKDGFSPSELWNLDHTILCFILPRLKAFADKTTGVPGSYIAESENEDSFELGTQLWREDLDKMIRAIEYVIEKEPYVCPPEITEGLDLFWAKFRNLWN
jgi:hypothetical protein